MQLPFRDEHIRRRKGLEDFIGPIFISGPKGKERHNPSAYDKNMPPHFAFKQYYEPQDKMVKASKALRLRDGDDCSLCQYPMLFDSNIDINSPDHAIRATIDHIIPASKFVGPVHPTHSLHLLQLAHAFCNTKKGNRLHITREWLLKNTKLQEKVIQKLSKYNFMTTEAIYVKIDDRKRGGIQQFYDRSTSVSLQAPFG